MEKTGAAMKTTGIAFFATALFATAVSITKLSAGADFSWLYGEAIGFSVGSSVAPAWNYTAPQNAPPGQEQFSYECCNPANQKCEVQISVPDGSTSSTAFEGWSFDEVDFASYTFQIPGQYKFTMKYTCYFVAHYPATTHQAAHDDPSLEDSGTTTPPVLIVVSPKSQ
jgi:hypothetical protein